MSASKPMFIQLPQGGKETNEKAYLTSEDTPGATPAIDAARNNQNSHQPLHPESADTMTERSSISEKLLSRAHTLLHSATIARSEIGDTGSNDIQAAISTLHREKTILKQSNLLRENENNETEEEASDIEHDSEMQFLLNEVKPKQDEQTNPNKTDYTDSDFDTDLEDDSPPLKQFKDLPPKDVYIKTCKKLSIKAIPAVSKVFESHTLEMLIRHRCLDALDMLSIANALVIDGRITRLVLDSNKIGDEGAKVVAWLLKSKGSGIELLSLADNCIGNEGVMATGEMLSTNKTLTSLNLAGNLAKDSSIAPISDALVDNRYLVSLNLSHNHLGDNGAELLAPALVANEKLVSLDLSWNLIRPSGAMHIFNALRENTNIKTLNFAMNGLSTPGAALISEVLKENETLAYLDVTYNRIFDEGAAYIAKGLRENHSLHHLIIYDNPITAIGVLSLLNSIKENLDTQMWKLDAHTISVVEKAVEIADDINDIHEEFDFRYGVVVDSLVPMAGEPNVINNKNPMTIVKEFVENEGLRMLEFFKLMDKDGGGSISREEFVEGLTSRNVPLSQAQVDKLINMLDKDGDGEIDYAELVQGDKEYRMKRRQRRTTEQEILKHHITRVTSTL